MYGDADLPALFADMGVAVVAGAVTTVGLLDDLPADAFPDRARIETRRRSVLVRAAVMPALHVGDALTVDGTAYTIREWGPEADLLDGRVLRIWLKDA